MRKLSWLHWTGMLLGGAVVGLILLNILPKASDFGGYRSPYGGPPPVMRSAPYPGVRPGGPYRPAPGPPGGFPTTVALAPVKPPITTYLPWVLVLGGLVIGVLFRKETGMLTFAGAAMTAGVTLLTTLR